MATVGHGQSTVGHDRSRAFDRPTDHLTDRLTNRLTDCLTDYIVLRNAFFY